MKSIEIYLTFNGNCKEAMDFYAGVFGGEILFMNTFAEMPPDPNYPMPEEKKDQIMHVTLQLKPGVTMMAADAMGRDVTIGDNFWVTIVPDSREEVDQLCAALSEGGEVTMAPAEMFWGSYFATCIDKFGINWMFNFDTSEE